MCDEFQFVNGVSFQSQDYCNDNLKYSLKIHELEQHILMLEEENRWLRSEIVKLRKNPHYYCEENNLYYFD